MCIFSIFVFLDTFLRVKLERPLLWSSPTPSGTGIWSKSRHASVLHKTATETHQGNRKQNYCDKLRPTELSLFYLLSHYLQVTGDTCQHAPCPKLLSPVSSDDTIITMTTHQHQHFWNCYYLGYNKVSYCVYTFFKFYL